MYSLIRWCCLLVALAWATSPDAANAYGAAGHRIAGLAAEPLLCPRASEEIAALSGGVAFADLGLWADRIRGLARWEQSAPWHYMNVSDDGNVREFRHPPEGDVLWAIEEFSARLADSGLSQSERGEALRFLIHFIVDIHQPLHVGRIEDRGGNRTLIRYGSTEVNLHRFWDRDAIELSGRSNVAYARSVRERVARIAATDHGFEPITWAEESFELRGRVYGYDAEGAEGAYLGAAERLTHERLALAAARLASSLNGIFCR